jgi:acyl transferase domain-containing protein
VALCLQWVYLLLMLNSSSSLLTGCVEISAYNGPKQLTLAGDRKSLEGLADSLQADNIFTRFIQEEIPYRSRFMDSLEPDISRP